MALILCLETSTEVCSVSLSEDGKLVGLAELSKGYQHASQITLLTDQCLDEAGFGLSDLDAVAVSRGPGSYTGLRVGVSAAKGYCLALDIPLLALDTLQCLANGIVKTLEAPIRDMIICPVIDARRQEVFTALYDNELCELKPAQSLIVNQEGLDSYLFPGKHTVFGGNAVHKIETNMGKDLFTFLDKGNSAVDMVEIAHKEYREKNYSDVLFCTPFYLKPPHITRPNKVL